jgi:hypothetical protein
VSKLRLPRRNLSLMIAVGELERVNASYTIERSRHYRIRWESNGSRGVFTIPVSASDHRSPLNTRAQIRRALYRRP